uniref:Uncharacterized protein n=1 Tax=Lepeophtheirus salmonis TaxID=72036 RepID=A0A0K2SXH4_LEPSM
MLHIPCAQYQFVSLERVSEDNVKFMMSMILHINDLFQLLYTLTVLFSYHAHYLVIMQINGLVELFCTLTV